MTHVIGSDHVILSIELEQVSSYMLEWVVGYFVQDQLLLLVHGKLGAYLALVDQPLDISSDAWPEYRRSCPLFGFHHS